MTASVLAAIGIATAYGRCRLDGDHARPPRGSAPTQVEAAVATEGPPSPRAAGDARRSAAPATALADRVAALRAALSSSDDAARIDAIESATAAGAVETLPLLEAMELRRDPDAAPAIIHAVAALGAQAASGERNRAAETLAHWLHDEAGRESADARGNVSLLVEALGDVGGAQAVDALRSALDEQTLPLHVETLAVENAARLADPRAGDAVARFAARVGALPQTEGLEEELRQEAIAAAATAAARLSL